MNPEKTVAFIALAWLISMAILLMRSIRRGRALAATLAERHPEIYEELGRPQPGYSQSPRGKQFARFIMRREYEKLGDSELCARFEDYRTAEFRLLVILLVTLGIVALLMVGVRYAV